MWPFVKFSGEHFESVASLILRVPGLFILDYWWLHASNNSSWTSTPTRGGGGSGDQLSSSIISGGDANRWTEDVVGAALVTLMPLQGLLLLMLSLERLVDLYMNYMSVILLVTAHLFSQHYINTEQHWSSMSPLGLADYLQQQEVRVDQQDTIQAIFGLNIVSAFSSSASPSTSSSSSIDQNFLKRQLVALIVHVAIASAVAFLLDLHQTSQRMMLAAYTLPVVARLSGLLPVAQQDLQSVHNLATAAIILQVIYYVLKYVPSVVQSSRNVFVRLARSLWSHGGTPLGLTVSTFGSLFVPLQFVVFWMLHVAAYLYYHLIVRQRAHGEWCLVLLRCVSDVCASPISLAGTAVSVSYVSCALLTATKFYLQGYRAFVLDNVMHSGWTEGLTMVLIAVQTGLIEIRMPRHRAAVMTIILFIVVSSLIQSMFEITEPLLLALSASRAGNLAKHVRTLALCAFLFAFPLYMTYVLCAIFPIDFWMLVVIASCVMTSVQVLGLLAVYVLFTYDSFRTEPWDGLDDVVYYARALTRVLEFIVAVFVVGAGVRESIAGNWSWINSSVLLVHCYFNVWQRLQAGWNSFLLRREAVRKIRSLPMATSEELASYGDVCSICYGEMKQSSGSHSPFSFSPVIVLLSCRHAYHAGCLRKWLYVQDKCPLCQAVIRQPTTTNVPPVQ